LQLFTVIPLYPHFALLRTIKALFRAARPQLYASRRNFQKRETQQGGSVMLYYALVFLVVALIAGFLGFGGVAFAAAGIAKILFFVFLLVFLVTLISHLMRGGAARL
jgi:uncharacterized membrane protein YtjA (UPF0391 family)